MIIFGKQIIFLTCSTPELRDRVETLYLSKEISHSDFKVLSALKKPILRLDNKKAQALARNGNHQGFLAKIKNIPSVKLTHFKADTHVLVLSNITDMGNIGALSRSAYALGFSGLVICGIRGFKLERAIRTSAGALLLLPYCIQQNVLDVANELKTFGYTLIGGHTRGEEHTKIQFKSGDKVALFLGSEEEGLGKRLLEKMQRVFEIKMSHSFNSLNVSVAGAILMDRIMEWKH